MGAAGKSLNRRFLHSARVSIAQERHASNQTLANANRARQSAAGQRPLSIPSLLCDLAAPPPVTVRVRGHGGLPLVELQLVLHLQCRDSAPTEHACVPIAVAAPDLFGFLPRQAVDVYEW